MTDRPAIKPLEWRHFDVAHEYGRGAYDANAGFGITYEVLDCRDTVRDFPYYCPKVSNQFLTLEEAQAAAQQDYEARIRSCLLDKPEAGEAEIERVARAIDSAWWTWADVHYSEDIPGDRLAKQKSLDRAKAAIAALSPVSAGDAGEEARQIIRGFLDCPEVSDCAPEDLDNETRDLERRARKFLAALSTPLGAEAVEMMRKALEPFAKCADEIDYEDKERDVPTSDEEWAKFRLLIGDYRRARAALSATKQEEAE